MDNYKFAIIFGEGNENIEDGEIRYIGNSRSDEVYSKDLSEFISQHYSFQNTLTGNPEKIAFLLTNMGNIVFLNLTHFDSESLRIYGKSGVLMLPDVITSSQMRTINNFIRQIEEYNVAVKGNMYLENDMLNCGTSTIVDRITENNYEQLIKKNTKIKAEITK